MWCWHVTEWHAYDFVIKDLITKKGRYLCQTLYSIYLIKFVKTQMDFTGQFLYKLFSISLLFPPFLLLLNWSAPLWADFFLRCFTSGRQSCQLQSQDCISQVFPWSCWLRKPVANLTTHGRQCGGPIFCHCQRWVIIFLGYQFLYFLLLTDSWDHMFWF